MSFWNKVKNDGNAQLKSLLGRINNRDFLPAFASAMALIVAADGHVDDSEVEGVIEFVTTDPTLAHWKVDDRTKAFEEALKAANAGAIRQASLWGNVSKLNGKPEAAALVELVHTLANVDGEFAPSEVAIFEKICKRVGVDPKSYI